MYAKQGGWKHEIICVTVTRLFLITIPSFLRVLESGLISQEREGQCFKLISLGLLLPLLKKAILQIGVLVLNKPISSHSNLAPKY